MSRIVHRSGGSQLLLSTKGETMCNTETTRLLLLLECACACAKNGDRVSLRHMIEELIIEAGAVF